MVAEFAAAFEGLKVASTIVKGIANLKTETEINLAIIDLQQVVQENWPPGPIEPGHSPGPAGTLPPPAPVPATVAR